MSGDLNAGPAKLKDNSKGSIVNHLGPLLTEIKKVYMNGDLNTGPAKLKDNSKGCIVHHLGPLKTKINRIM
jgi:hypothetical protein